MKKVLKGTNKLTFSITWLQKSIEDPNSLRKISFESWRLQWSIINWIEVICSSVVALVRLVAGINKLQDSFLTIKNSLTDHLPFQLLSRHSHCRQSRHLHWHSSHGCSGVGRHQGWPQLQRTRHHRKRSLLEQGLCWSSRHRSERQGIPVVCTQPWPVKQPVFLIWN